MHKFKKYLIIISCGLFLSNPFISYAAPEAETTTEESTEKTTEKKEKVKKEWVQDKDTGKWQYEVDGEAVIGWRKIKKKWYYFGADGFRQENTKIGTYILDAEGVLINPGEDKDFKPEPHGVIKNSTTNSSIIKNTENIKNVTDKINNLYTEFTNDKIIDINNIKETRFLYNSLSMAEKAGVNNETYLAEIENKYGIIYDYDSIYATVTDASQADGDTKQGTSYIFTIDDKNTAISVIVRFTTDTNMDGIGDVPSVSLLSPNGDSITIDTSSPEIRTSAINTALTWTDNYLQMDISNAENGNWTILTDISCAFISQDYAGNKKNLNPIPSTGKKATETDAEKESKSEEEQSKLPLVFLAVTVAAFVGIFLWMKKNPATPAKKSDKTKKNAQPSDNSDDVESLKQELLKMEAEYVDDDYDKSETVQIDTNKQTKTTFTQEEMNESLEEYSAGTADMYRNSFNDTDILSSIENNIENQQDNEDLWYEEEE